MSKFFLFVLALFLVGFAGAQLNYEVDTSVIEAVVSIGEGVTIPITISSNENPENIKLEPLSKDSFFSVSESSLSLDSLDKKIIDVVLDSTGLDEGIYVGYLNIEDGELNKLPVLLEVQSPQDSLWFDISIEPNSEKVSLSPGADSLDLRVNVFNLGSNRPDVVINYFISDLSGLIFYEDSQQLFIKDNLEFSKSISIPGGLESGDYVFYSTIEGDGSIGTDSIIVNVRDEILTSPPTSTANYWIFLVLIFLVASFLIINYLWDRRVRTVAKNWNQRVVDLKRVKFSNVAREIRRLEGKVRLLDRAHEKNYIKKSSYDESRKHINGLIIKLKKRL